MIKKIAKSLCLAASIVMLGSYIAAQSTAALIGKWQGDVTTPMGSMTVSLELRSQDNKTVGELKNPHGDWTITAVKLEKGKWHIAWRTPEGGTGKMIGVVKDNKLSGDWDFSPNFVGTFEFTKAH